MFISEETPFFVSYPRTGNLDSATSSDQLVKQFYDRLCEDVAPLVHLLPGADKGFLDIDGLTGGMIWNPELRRALGSCQVLVALLTVRYLKSEWCGKEWHAFASRTRSVTAGNGPNQSSIIPVLWAPIPEHHVPAFVSDQINIFSPTATRRNPDLPKQYTTQGLFGLLHEREDDAASEIIWQLAMLIQRVYYSQKLESRQFEPDELINVFGEGQI